MRNELSATLTPVEWDYIGNLLKKQPWGEVDGLIAKLNNQFISQQQTPTSTPPADSEGGEP